MSVNLKYQKSASGFKQPAMVGTPITPKSKNKKLIKYWCQRYNLFSRFDDGVQLDDEAWYSVTPERIARHISQRFHTALGDGHIVICDGFCGVGGNLIQFALHSPHVRVVGCDIDPDRIQMAKHNARIYGVANQCDFILGDFMKLMPSLESYQIDAVFLSPPWGGVDYQALDKYSLNSMTPNGFEIVESCRKHISKNIAFLMPRNIDIDEVRKNLLNKENPLLECEQNMVGAKIKTITMYFGGLVGQDDQDTEGHTTNRRASTNSDDMNSSDFDSDI